MLWVGREVKGRVGRDRVCGSRIFRYATPAMTGENQDMACKLSTSIDAIGCGAMAIVQCGVDKMDLHTGFCYSTRKSVCGKGCQIRAR
jgi:hypothetical protein